MVLGSTEHSFQQLSVIGLEQLINKRMFTSFRQSLSIASTFYHLYFLFSFSSACIWFFWQSLFLIVKILRDSNVSREQMDALGQMVEELIMANVEIEEHHVLEMRNMMEGIIDLHEKLNLVRYCSSQFVPHTTKIFMKCSKPTSASNWRWWTAFSIKCRQICTTRIDDSLLYFFKFQAILVWWFHFYLWLHLVLLMERSCCCGLYEDQGPMSFGYSQRCTLISYLFKWIRETCIVGG